MITPSTVARPSSCMCPQEALRLGSELVSSGLFPRESKQLQGVVLLWRQRSGTSKLLVVRLSSPIDRRVQKLSDIAFQRIGNSLQQQLVAMLLNLMIITFGMFVSQNHLINHVVCGTALLQNLLTRLRNNLLFGDNVIQVQIIPVQLFQLLMVVLFPQLFVGHSSCLEFSIPPPLTIPIKQVRQDPRRNLATFSSVQLGSLASLVSQRSQLFGLHSQFQNQFAQGIWQQGLV
mmetsp:Transcript_7443/g.13570  ORF Transcript_7443/g.13570 Transcript_7443/m.13570 type:complete len:232 (-) Transcript_7443:91-786(-)